MEAILVYGATGYTGRLVVRALEEAGRRYLVGGRNRAALEALSLQLPSRPEVRVAEADDSAALMKALGGVRAVVSTVGPFGRWGMPMASAAVDLGVHYVDTTGEASFQMQVHEKLHRRAISTGATVVTGAAFEYTFSYLGAALLHERCGPLLTMSSYYLADGFRPTVGTARSALAMLGEELVAFRDGALIPLPTERQAREVRFPGEKNPYYAVVIPGGDAVTLPLDIAPLQSATCHILLSQGAARILAPLAHAQPRLRAMLKPSRLATLDRLLARWHRDPREGERAANTWKVFVHGQSPTGSHVFVASGRDVYAISGVTAAQTAAWLADGRGRDGGVMTTGKALPAVEFLDALKPHGVRWELR
ncbi:MAG: trans-acting enoyl reductase family protein [Candidatus Binatia bacterium]